MFTYSMMNSDLIWTNKGIVSVGELKVGDEFRNINGDKFILCNKKEHLNDLHKIVTSEGYRLYGSGCMPLKVFSNKKNWKDGTIIYRNLDKMRLRDKIYIDLDNDLFNEKPSISGDMTILIGSLLADGTFGCRVNGRGYATWYFNKSSNLINIYYNSFKREFQCKPQLASYPSRSDTTLRTDKQLVIKELLNVGLKPGPVYVKEIPEIIFKQPRENIILFLASFFDGDGHIQKSNGIVSCFSVNPQLINQIQQLLLSLGIRSRIRSQKGSTGRIKGLDGYRIVLSKAESFKFNSSIKLKASEKSFNQFNFMNKHIGNSFYQLPYITVSEVCIIEKQECSKLYLKPI